MGQGDNDDLRAEDDADTPTEPARYGSDELSELLQDAHDDDVQDGSPRTVTFRRKETPPGDKP